MTAETPWRSYKTITNMLRANDLPVARVLYQKNMQKNNGFEQVWPKIFNMIRINSKKYAEMSMLKLKNNGSSAEFNLVQVM